MTDTELSEAQRAVLLDLPARFTPERIDHLWIFPPRLVGEKESGLFVLSLLTEPAGPGPERTVVTLRYDAERARGRLRRADSVAEQGHAPTERVPRVIAGVLARLGDAAEEPREAHIGGSPARWSSLLRSLGVGQLDPPNGE